jgi:hypothetical protein
MNDEQGTQLVRDILGDGAWHQTSDFYLSREGQAAAIQPDTVGIILQRLTAEGVAEFNAALKSWRLPPKD